MGNNGQHRGRKVDAELTRHGICRDEGIRAKASCKKLDPSVSPELTSTATIKQWRTHNKMCSTGALHIKKQMPCRRQQNADRGGGLRKQQLSENRMQSERKGPQREP